MLVIALESSKIFTSDATGTWIMRVLNWFHRPTLDAVLHANYLVRKTGHFTGYAILSAFYFHGWMATLAYQTGQFLRRAGKTLRLPRRWHMRPAVLAVLCTLIVASLDEFHQAFIPGRTSSPRDVVLDTMGAIFAQILLLLYWSREKAPSGVRSEGEVSKSVVGER